MKKLLSLALLAYAAGGCSSETSGEDNSNPIVEETQPSQISGEKSYKREKVRALRQRLGEGAVNYAVQIIDNGGRIKKHPQKQERLGELEQKLRKSFPLIKPQRLFGFIDDSREVENIAMLYSAQQRVLARTQKDGVRLPMSFIIAALCNEGFSLDVDRPGNVNGGFSNYGLDNFGSEFKHIAKRGYLPLSFQQRFAVSEHINEQHRRVKSANFETKQDAFEAFVATLAHRQYLFLQDLKKNRIKARDIPPEQKLFFTYKYYNGGPDSIEGLLKKRSAEAINHFFRRTITYGSTGNAYVVLTGHLWLESSGATDPHPQGKYWWSGK